MSDAPSGLHFLPIFSIPIPWSMVASIYFCTSMGDKLFQFIVHYDSTTIKRLVFLYSLIYDVLMDKVKRDISIFIPGVSR